MVGFNHRVLCMLGAMALIAAAGIPALASEGQNKDRLFWLQFTEEYRFRSVSSVAGDTLFGKSQSDHDARVYAAAGFRDSKDRFYVTTSLGAWFDLDGIDNGTPGTLGSIYDVGDPAKLDVYSLYGEYHTSGWLKEIRLGRQQAEYGLSATYDGLHARIRPLPIVDVFLFGGRTVHYFEEGADLFEDWMGSGGLSIRPLERLRLDLDYRFTMEDTALEEGLMEHGYGATIWFQPIDWLYLKALGRGIDEQFTHAGLNSRLEWASLGLGIRLGMESQLVTLRELNEGENPYFAILGESLPHTRWEAAVWKSFATSAGTYSLEAGWNGRANHKDEAAFNRDYGKIYLMFAAEDIGIKGPFVQVALEDHFAQLGPSFDDEGQITVGGAAGWATHKLRIEAGSWYQRFKYDYFQDVREIEDVRTVYGAVTWRALDWLSVKARYAYENMDRDLHSVFLTLSQSY